MAWGARRRRRKQVTKKQAWEARGDRHTQQEGGDDDDDGDDRRIEEEEGANCERRRRKGGLKAQVENAEGGDHQSSPSPAFLSPSSLLAASAWESSRRKFGWERRQSPIGA